VIDLSAMPAADRLRLFEDQMLGPDAVRIDGRVEDGIGSRFSCLCPADQKHHADLVRLVETEVALATAADAYADAQASHEAGQKAASASARYTTVQVEREEA
jgi:hypothetical protein